MSAASVTYNFSQRFHVPAGAAYRWCTNYEPTDLQLMNETGNRDIERITKDTLILKEVILRDGQKIRKTKLVKLHPTTLSWTNVQLSGPNKHSEFLYKIIPEGRGGSRLNFTAHLVVYGKTALTSREVRGIAETERAYDADAWKLLAEAMEQECNRRRKHA